LRRTLNRLSAVVIGRTKAAGYLHDGGGLYLQISDTGARSWVYRFSLHGKRRDMGLGPFPEISLAAARQLAQDARALAKAGADPIAARDALRASRRLEAARGVTWDQAVEMFLAAHESTWRNAKHRQQWRNTLRTYASPVMDRLAVADIGTPEVTKALDPIWTAKLETARRVRGRIERVLDWAKVRDLRAGENPARWRGHLDQVYPGRGKARHVKHHAAVPIDNLPAVYARLRQADGIAAKALRFCILTASRPGETTGATWQEIDRPNAMWIVPAERMKSGKEHRVPLSREALAIVNELAKLRTGDLVFPGGRAGRPLSALGKALRSAGGGKATPHGTARSSFRDWASERTTFAAEVAEMALAHVVSDKTERAYRRGELLEKRRAMMEQWARFLRTPSAGNVVAIGRRKRA
jgi:integrase